MRDRLCRLALLLALSTPSGAATLFVSVTGDDAAAGTRMAPLRTLARSAALAQPGTTVYLLAGTYHEQLLTRRAGTQDAPIVFTRAEGQVVLDGSSLQPEDDRGVEQNRGIVEIRHAWNVVRGLAVRNSPYSGIVLAASHVTVENNEVSSTRRHAISTDTRFQPSQPAGMLRDLRVACNSVTRAVQRGLGHGQAISIIADGFAIEGNEVRDNHTEGIDVWLGARNGLVLHNHVHHNVRTGIYLDGVENVEVRANRVHHNGRWTDGTAPGEQNGHGIGVSSEDVRYATRDVRVVDNSVHDNERTGIFIWDNPRAPGHAGAQEVLIASNTVHGNGQAPIWVLDGVGSTGEIAHNVHDGSMGAMPGFQVHHNASLQSRHLPDAEVGTGDPCAVRARAILPPAR